MALAIRPFRPDEARTAASWTYGAPFDIYDAGAGAAAVYLRVEDDGLGYYAVVAEPDELVGFCCFGAEARVPGQVEEPGTLDVGAGVRPDQLSRGVGTRLLRSALEFGSARFAPVRFRAAVAVFNERSTRLCLSAGFEVVRTFDGPGGRPFRELVRPAISARSSSTHVAWRRTSAYVVCRDDDCRILLTRFRGPGHPDDGKWTMPGGGMEWGETAERTAIRELAEETGLTATLGPVMGVFSRWFTAEESARGEAGHLLGIVFRADDARGTLRTDFADDTTDAVAWFTMGEVSTTPHVELVEFVLTLLGAER